MVIISETKIAEMIGYMKIKSVETELRKIAAMRGDGKKEGSLAWAAAEELLLLKNNAGIVVYYGRLGIRRWLKL